MASAPLDEARKLFVRGKYQECLDILQRLPDQDRVDIQHNILCCRYHLKQLTDQQFCQSFSGIDNQIERTDHRRRLVLTLNGAVFHFMRHEFDRVSLLLEPVLAASTNRYMVPEAGFLLVEAALHRKDVDDAEKLLDFLSNHCDSVMNQTAHRYLSVYRVRCALLRNKLAEARQMIESSSLPPVFAKLFLADLALKSLDFEEAKNITQSLEGELSKKTMEHSRLYSPEAFRALLLNNRAVILAKSQSQSVVGSQQPDADSLTRALVLISQALANAKGTFYWRYVCYNAGAILMAQAAHSRSLASFRLAYECFSQGLIPSAMDAPAVQLERVAAGSIYCLLMNSHIHTSLGRYSGLVGPVETVVGGGIHRLLKLVSSKEPFPVFTNILKPRFWQPDSNPKPVTNYELLRTELYSTLTLISQRVKKGKLSETDGMRLSVRTRLLLGETSLRLDDPITALRHLQDVQDKRAQVGMSPEECTPLQLLLAEAYVRLNRAEPALAALCDPVFEQSKSPSDIPMRELNVAYIQILAGDLQAALETVIKLRSSSLSISPVFPKLTSLYIHMRLGLVGEALINLHDLNHIQPIIQSQSAVGATKTDGSAAPSGEQRVSLPQE